MKILNKKCVLMFVLAVIICQFKLIAIEKNKTQIYTLEQLIQLAQKNNLLLEISKWDRKISLAEYKSHRALPDVGFEYSQGKFSIPGESLKTDIWGMGLKWSIPNPFYRHFLLKSQRSNITEADIKAEMSKREIIKNLKNHYYLLQFYKKILIFWKERQQRLTEINEITKAKVSIGESKEIDYLRSSVEMQKNKTHLFRIQKTIAFEKTKLNELLNYTLSEDFLIEEDFSIATFPDIENKLDQLIKDSPLIRLRFNQLNREVYNQKAKSLSIIEEIEIFAEKEKEFEGEKWKVGLGISIPVFNWKSASIQKAKYQRQKAQVQVEHEKKHFYADIQRIVSEIRVLEKEIETFKGAILTEGKESMLLSETLYREGEIPLMVFLDSQDSFFEIQERYYEAITQWKILNAEIEELIGE